MNNNEFNFDSITGQPINNTNVSQQNIPIVGLEQTNMVYQSQLKPQPVEQPVQNNNFIQQPIQNVPTVEQSKQEFINNTQSLNSQKKEEKKEGVNYTFIIILFIIIFASIFFLFPFLLKYI